MSPNDTVLSLVGHAHEIALHRDELGRATLAFEAPAGLYQFSVVMDASRFDWERLYTNLKLFENKGQRTGPWEFSLTGHFTPVVPAYGVDLDGRRLGLWPCERVSLDDLAARRFRGRMAFHVMNPGRHELALAPYKPDEVEWISARLEVDPEDHLEPLPEKLRTAPGIVPAAAWAQEAFWSERRKRLQTTHAGYNAVLQEAFDSVMADANPSPDYIPMLMAAERLGGRTGGVLKAVGIVEAWTSRPAWGNEAEDGYGHNSDMAAALPLRALAHAWHMLGDALPDPLRRRCLEKLALQGNIFYDQALLYRDYWGGSLTQDHGWRSLFPFGVMALHMHGILPDADRWLQYILPRLDRSLCCMSSDGVIQQSSYFSARLYLFETTFYRDALLALSGRDIFAGPPFKTIVRFTHETMRREDASLPLAWQGNHRPLAGSNGFFNQMAATFRDSRAADIGHALLGGIPATPLLWDDKPNRRLGALWGFMSFDPTVPPDPRRATRSLRHYEDAGLVHYRDDEEDAALSLRCGVPNSRTAYFHAAGPCDRLQEVPDAGHFSLSLRGVPRLMTPDRGYALHTAIRSCMLVDGRGQLGDEIGYPMSIPSTTYNGVRIDFARWDEATGTGVVRLNLTRAYPREFGLVGYTRDFTIRGKREIAVRDVVDSSVAHTYSWLFQSMRDLGMELQADGRCRLGQAPALWLTPRPMGFELRADLRETEIVWSYGRAGGGGSFDHVRYETTAPRRNAAVEFILSW